MEAKKEKKPKGRPPTLNRTELHPEELLLIEEHAQYLTQPQLADFLGLDRAALSRIMDKDPEVAAAYRRGKMKMLNSVASVLVQKALDGDTTSCIFLLKTQGGWCEKQKIEHSGSLGPQVTIFELPNNGRS